MKVHHKQLIEEQLKKEIKSTLPIHGGCTGSVHKITFTDDSTALAKSDQADRLSSEAQGLNELAKFIKVPSVFFIQHDMLVTEWIDTRPMIENDKLQLAQTLRQLHSHQADYFGFRDDNYLGASKQLNTPELGISEGWSKFYWIYRISPQLEAASKQFSIPDSTLEKIKLKTFQTLEGVETSSSLHGDLWAGNVLINKNSEPVLIDPAVYYGDADAEFGLVECFEGLGDAFYESYYQDSDKQKDMKTKLPLYKLYHMLNHLNIFGTAYLKQCQKLIGELI